MPAFGNFGGQGVDPGRLVRRPAAGLGGRMESRGISTAERVGRREVFARVKFAELTQVALLGTERQAMSPATGDSELNRLLAQLDLNQRDEGLLSAAAICGLHEEIGQLPRNDLAPARQPCAPEELPRLSERAGSLLMRLLGGEFPELLPECLALCAQAGQLPFPEALPALLGAGLTRAEGREAILPLLGKRGHWLATQNPDWAWAMGVAEDDENIWQVGGSAARSLFLQRRRRQNPARARDLLAATWKEETPEDRAGFIAVLEIGLGAEDEPFLEAALDDKRKDVRRNASTLLARLPGSALVARMITRVKPLLRFNPGEAGSLLKLKKATPPSLEILLPGECDKPMQRDGIEPKPPAGFGEKIGWVMQMLEIVPLAQWTTEWNVPPAEIVAVSLQGEWKKELFEAWTRAAIRQKDAVWAEALLGIAVPAKRTDKFAGLLAALPEKQRELRLAVLLETDDAKARESLGNLISSCQHKWSPEFSRTILIWLRQTTARQSADWQFRTQFSHFATRLAVATLNEAPTGWPMAETPEWEFWSKGVDEFLALAQFRADLHAAFPKPSSANHPPP